MIACHIIDSDKVIINFLPDQGNQSVNKISDPPKIIEI